MSMKKLRRLQTFSINKYDQFVDERYMINNVKIDDACIEFMTLLIKNTKVTFITNRSKLNQWICQNFECLLECRKNIN